MWSSSVEFSKRPAKLIYTVAQADLGVTRNLMDNWWGKIQRSKSPVRKKSLPIFLTVPRWSSSSYTAYPDLAVRVRRAKSSRNQTRLWEKSCWWVTRSVTPTRSAEVPSKVSKWLSRDAQVLSFYTPLDSCVNVKPNATPRQTQLLTMLMGKKFVTVSVNASNYEFSCWSFMFRRISSHGHANDGFS
jgi:hypothetical protein